MINTFSKLKFSAKNYVILVVITHPPHKIILGSAASSKRVLTRRQLSAWFEVRLLIASVPLTYIYCNFTHLLISIWLHDSVNFKGLERKMAEKRRSTHLLFHRFDEIFLSLKPRIRADASSRYLCQHEIKNASKFDAFSLPLIKKVHSDTRWLIARTWIF